MIRRNVITISVVVGSALLVSSCTGNRTTPGTASTPTSSGSAATPTSDAPTVENPLPAKVLDGGPCGSALTADQLSSFLGKTSPAKSSEDSLGNACGWTSASGSGAAASVGYQTKSDQGIGLAFQSVKPTAARWDNLDAIQGYPAVGYVPSGVDPTDKRNCVVVVGISDKLAYSVSLTLGDRAASEGKDSCVIGRDIADAVMTNLKQRA